MRKMPTTKQIDELQKMIDNGGGSGSDNVYVIRVNNDLTFNADPTEVWTKLTDHKVFVVAIYREYVYFQTSKETYSNPPKCDLNYKMYIRNYPDTYYHIGNIQLSYQQGSNKFTTTSAVNSKSLSFMPIVPDTTNNYELTCKAGDIAWTIGGNAKVFIAVKGTTTTSEIEAAYTSGNYDIIIAKLETFPGTQYRDIYYLSSANPTTHIYTFNGAQLDRSHLPGLRWTNSATTGETVDTRMWQHTLYVALEPTNTSLEYAYTAVCNIITPNSQSITVETLKNYINNLQTIQQDSPPGIIVSTRYTYGGDAGGNILRKNNGSNVFELYAPHWAESQTVSITQVKDIAVVAVSFQ